MPRPEKKLIDIGKLWRSARNKTSRFIHQKILAGSKALLLVGGDSNPNFRDKFVHKCKSSWKIAGLSQNSFQCDMHLTLNNLSQSSVGDIEKRVKEFHKLYESVVMLPEKSDGYKSVTDNDFLEEFYP